jgi:enamine deaminase RidA (YjgF/YER057c/UK114 family)
MHKIHNPATIAAPLSKYAHAVEIPAAARRLYVSGQLGIRPDGTLAEGFEAQAKQAWSNIIAILEAAGMGVTDIVKYTTFITQPEVVAANRAIREQVLGDVRAASTLLVIAALAAPDYLVEIEVVAAKVG